MRDDDAAPNGRPGPFGPLNGAAPNGAGTNGRHTNGEHTNGLHTNGSGHLGSPFTRVLPGADEASVDLVAVQADDELVNAVGSRQALPPSGGTTDDRLVTLLAAWRAEIDAEPIPELVDLDTAVAAVAAGVAAQDFAARRRRAGRFRQLAPLVAAAAIIVATVTGVGLGSQDAMPGDTLWAIQKVVNPERAESVEAKVAVEGRLQKVRAALEKGDTVTAAHELQAISTEIPAVRGEEGQPLLTQEQEFLAAKLADTPPGIPADLSTPPKSNPAARSTGTPAPPPSSGVPATDPSATGSSASEPPSPTAPSPTEPDPRDRPNPALVPQAPAEPDSSGPAAPKPEPSAPDVTRAPEVIKPDPKSDDPGPGNTEGGKDGKDGKDSKAPGPVDDPPVPGTGTKDGASGSDGGTVITTSDTATASGPRGASDEVAPPDTTTT